MIALPNGMFSMVVRRAWHGRRGTATLPGDGSKSISVSVEPMPSLNVDVMKSRQLARGRRQRQQGDRRMATTMKDAATDRAEDAMAQIARLREQVETLIRDKVAPAVGTAAGRAEEAAYEAADVVRGRAEALAGTVRSQP